MAPQDGNRQQVGLESLTDQDAIFKAVRNKCIQSPFTIIPLALAGGLLLLTGAFGLGFFGVFTSIVLGMLGAAAFVYNMWIRGETLAKRHVQWLMEQLKEQRRGALTEVAEMCRKIGFYEAEKEAAELSEAYSQYTGFLESRAEAKLGAAVGQRLGLAEAARTAGIEHLRQAAEIHTALTAIDIAMLRRELAQWHEQKSHARANHTVLDSKIDAHSRQILRYGQLVSKRDELIARSNELEAALKNAYMSDAGRSDLSLVHGANDPAARLSNAIAAAEAAEADMTDFLRNVEQQTTTPA
ncbi:MAG: hypothetical protein ACQCXQ_08740 [Verrucomicrobiales bacterium]